MFRLLTKQLKRHRYGLTQAVALFFAATILIASIGRTKAAALRPTPPPITVAAGDGGLFSSSGDDWLVNLMLAAVAFAGTTSLLFLCAKRSKGTTPPPKVRTQRQQWQPASDKQGQKKPKQEKPTGLIHPPTPTLTRPLARSLARRSSSCCAR